MTAAANPGPAVSDAALAAPPAPGAETDAAGADPPPREPSEADRVAGAVRALRTRGTPHQVRVRLIEAGCDPDLADRVVTKARARLLADSRKQGARVAELTVWAMCGTLALLLIPGAEVLVATLLGGAIVVMAIAGLIWLSGVGGD